MAFNFHQYSALIFFVVGAIMIVLTLNMPIGDFGNYYYGSRLFLENKFSLLDYQSIHYFNEQVRSHGEHNYFENYTPVLPFSLLFYLPLSFLSVSVAKLIFNFLSLLFFCFSLQRIVNLQKQSCSAISTRALDFIS